MSTTTTTAFEPIPEPAWQGLYLHGPGLYRWTVPPVAQGQIVERAYATGDEDPNGVPIYRRTTDRSDGSVTYERRYLGDDEAFEPWQSAPVG